MSSPVPQPSALSSPPAIAPEGSPSVDVEESAMPSSPLFYSSSSGHPDVSSPAPMDPRTPRDDIEHSGDELSRSTESTPRAAGSSHRSRIDLISSPLQYSSSSPRTRIGRSSSIARTDIQSGNFRSELSTHLRSSSSTPRARRRGDIHSSGVLSPLNRRATATITNPSAHTDNLGSSGSNSLSQATFSANSDGLPSDAGAVPYRVVWGTNVSLVESTTQFTGFLQGFRRKYRMVQDGLTVRTGEGEDRVYYDMLQDMYKLGVTNLNLDIQDLRSYPPARGLYYNLLKYPQELIPVMDQAVRDTVIEMMTSTLNLSQAEIAEHESQVVYKVRPFGLASSPTDISRDQLSVSDNGDGRIKGLRELNPGDIDKLVAVKGLILRSTPIIPDMKAAFYKCNVCSHVVIVDIDRGVVNEPTQCPRPACLSKHSLQLVHNRCEYADKQVIKLQETPDVVPDGQTPHSVALCVYDELVDACKAGDRVEITGIFRSIPVRVNPAQRKIKSLFKTFVDVLHIQKIDKRRLGLDMSTLTAEGEFLEQVTASGSMAAGSQRMTPTQEVDDKRKITAEDVEKIKETSKRPDIYELLSRSLAPSIYEMDDVKKGILLQLFGGANKTFEKSGSPRFRGDINVLLCGDPSTSKSQLLQYVHKISPRGVYTSGKGSSAVGLTAYVTRDPDTKQLVLESGALVLSDGGTCCIDEFDKMSDATRSVLHEVMEQQTVSIAKAGIITTLNARTSILASANPIGSRYDPNLPVTQNIDLPPTLLSRFDLVYLILDKVDESADRRLARHLAGLYLEDTPETGSPAELLPVEFLTMYISYARENISPIITEEAKEILVNAYVELRKLGEDVRAAERRVTATTRQLESMIRLAEAHARMRLSLEVQEKDVLEAVRLIRSAIKDYATDPVTGRIDMDLIQTGTSAAQRRMRTDLRREVLSVLEELLSGSAAAMGGVRYLDLLRHMNDQSSIHIENLEFGDAIRGLEQEGLVSVAGEGVRRMIRRVGRA
ncbi:MCM2/3/5 family-domain-containing protein [Lipomyces oligophaga]|uniref:MCM2/3/5 family-domain-containing protein n=1 Tax=Lipomyces oligophaga TaxID=45792 RepID=UPI0034CEFDB7